MENFKLIIVEDVPLEQPLTRLSIGGSSNSSSPTLYCLTSDLVALQQLVLRYAVIPKRVIHK